MIRQPTVIIFGAGASSDYGFPFGDQWLRIIEENLRPIHYTWIPKLIECGLSRKEVEKFRQALHSSRAFSVDSFLEKRIEFNEVGRLVIALSLIEREVEDQLFTGPPETGCYQYIFGKMRIDTRFEEFDNNQLTIITFNYDRSFEHYLFTALMNTYGKSYQECATVTRKVPIIHVHGSLGKLPWQLPDADEKDEKRDYTPKIGPEELRIAADQIIIVSDADDASEEFKRAIQCLVKAQRVYFLGFGYNGTNLNRLQIKGMPTEIRGMNSDTLSKWQMRGSALNLGMAEVQQIQSEWKIYLPNTYVNCLDFLRNFAVLS